MKEVHGIKFSEQKMYEVANEGKEESEPVTLNEEK